MTFLTNSPKVVVVVVVVVEVVVVVLVVVVEVVVVVVVVVVNLRFVYQMRYLTIPGKYASHHITTTSPPMHQPMHGPACPSTPNPIRPHLKNFNWNYTILLLKFFDSTTGLFLRVHSIHTLLYFRGFGTGRS